MRFLPASFSLVLMVLVVACGGGGGGGEGRTRDTSIRIIHGAIDSIPISVRAVGEESGLYDVVQTARYVEPTAYIRVKEGPQTIKIERANAPEVVLATIIQDFKKETEYSLFAFSNKANGAFSFRIIEEPVVQPEKGLARIRFLNAVDGQSTVSIKSAGLVLPPVEIGSYSEFADVPAGPRHVEFRGPSGKLLEAKNIVLAERGETTLLVSGSTEFDTFFVTSYDDLD